MPSSDWSAPAGTDYRDAGIALAPFSSRGPVLNPGGAYTKPDVAAPGVTVSAADAGTTTGYVAMSGTSMATPYVAGVAALALQAAPAATPAAVKAAIESTARDRGAAGKDPEWGSGLVDAEAAVQAASGATNSVATGYPTASRLTGSVSTGGSTAVAVPVTATGVPLAVTLTITSGSQGCLLYWPGQGCAWPGEWSPDLDAELRSPSGAVVATSQCALSGWLCTAGGRQETLLVGDPVVGTYSLRVYAWNGGPGGTFAADVSTGPVVGSGAPPPPPPDQPPTRGQRRTGPVLRAAEGREAHRRHADRHRHRLGRHGGEPAVDAWHHCRVDHARPRASRWRRAPTTTCSRPPTTTVRRPATRSG